MKISYLANSRLPTEKAHGIQIVNMCSALSEAGHQVTLIIPRRHQINSALSTHTINSYYNPTHQFKIIRLPALDLLPLHQHSINTGPIAFYLLELTFALLSALYLIKQNTLVFTRSKYVAILNGLLGKRVIYEAHDSATGGFVDKLVASNSSLVVTITKHITATWSKITSFVYHSPDGVTDQFFTKISQSKARATLGLPSDKKILLYTGNLDAQKGVYTLLKAARTCKHVQFYFVGGSTIDDNIAPFTHTAADLANVFIIGHRPYQQIPIWLASADILCIPTSAKSTKSAKDTSSLKLFEYLASGRPIIASSTPANCEILDSKSATFFTPDSPKSLTQVINILLKQSAKSNLNNIKLAKKYTWTKRATSIINHYTSHNPIS